MARCSHSDSVTPLARRGRLRVEAHSSFESDWVQDGRDAQAAIRVEPFAAIVLDLGLPGLGGLELLRGERGRGNKVPVLILTARDAVQDRITGLDSGADDYAVKPTDLDELAARLRALVRRSKGEPAPLLRIESLVLDPAARTVTRDGHVVDLQPREFTLLQELMLNAGRVLSREPRGTDVPLGRGSRKRTRWRKCLTPISRRPRR